MNTFKYEGINSSGKKVKGDYTGTEESLIEEMRSRKIIITSIKSSSENKKKQKFNKKLLLQNIEEIYYLLTAGMNLDEALKTVINNSKNYLVKELWQLVLNNLKKGNTFSIALKEASINKKIQIEDFYINIISAGEEIGDIPGALKKIIEDINFKNKITSEIKSALSYPIFLMVVSVLAIFFISVFILPRFSTIFSENEITNLPLVSKLVILSGKYLKENIQIFLLFCLLIIGFIVFLFNSKKIRIKILDFIYTLPGIKNIILYINLSNIFSSMSTMLAGGIEITKAISMTAKISKDESLKQLLNHTKDEIKKGKKISEIWASSNIIPNEAIALLTVAERSAKMPEIFDSLSKKYLLYFKESVSKFLVLLEPAIIVILGLFIAFIVVAIMLAVMSLSDIGF